SAFYHSTYTSTSNAPNLRQPNKMSHTSSSTTSTRSWAPPAGTMTVWPASRPHSPNTRRLRCSSPRTSRSGRSWPCASRNSPPPPSTPPRSPRPPTPANATHHRERPTTPPSGSRPPATPPACRRCPPRRHPRPRHPPAGHECPRRDPFRLRRRSPDHPHRLALHLGVHAGNRHRGALDRRLHGTHPRSREHARPLMSKAKIGAIIVSVVL